MRFKTTLNRFRETMSTPPLDLNRSINYSLICLFILVFFPRNVFSQEILLNATTDGTMVQACEGVFKDSGLGLKMDIMIF